MFDIEPEVHGRFVRLGGTKTMNVTFAGLWITHPPQPEYAKDETGRYVTDDAGELQEVWSTEAAEQKAKWLHAVDVEHRRRVPYAAVAPNAGESWEEYVARCPEPPDVFALPVRVTRPTDPPMIWVDVGVRAADGTTMFVWAPDFMEAIRRREAEQARIAAEKDVARIAKHRAVVTFQRALRRIEHGLKRHAPRLKGTLFDVEETRRHRGTCLGRHRRSGLEEAARWFAQVAEADRVSVNRQHSNGRQRDAARTSARAFDLVAKHIRTLLDATKGPAAIVCNACGVVRSRNNEMGLCANCREGIGA